MSHPTTSFDNFNLKGFFSAESLQRTLRFKSGSHHSSQEVPPERATAPVRRVMIEQFAPLPEGSSDEEEEEEDVGYSIPTEPVKGFTSLPTFQVAPKLGVAKRVARVRERVAELTESIYLQLLVAVATGYSLFGPQIRQLFFDVRSESVFLAIEGFFFLVLLFDFAANFLSRNGYFREFYCWVELAVLVSVAGELPVVVDRIPGNVHTGVPFGIISRIFFALSFFKTAKFLKAPFTPNRFFGVAGTWQDFCRREERIRRLCTDFLRGDVAAAHVLTDSRNSRLGGLMKIRMIRILGLLVFLIYLAVPLFDAQLYLAPIDFDLPAISRMTTPFFLSRLQNSTIALENLDLFGGTIDLTKVVMDEKIIFQSPFYHRLRPSEVFEVKLEDTKYLLPRQIVLSFSLQRIQNIRAISRLSLELMYFFAVLACLIHHLYTFRTHFFGVVPAVLQKVCPASLHLTAPKKCCWNILQTTEELLACVNQLFGPSQVPFLLESLFKFDTDYLKMQTAKKSFGLLATYRIADLDKIFLNFDVDPSAFLSNIAQVVHTSFQSPPAIQSCLGDQLVLWWKIPEVTDPDLLSFARLKGVTSRLDIFRKLKLKEKSLERLKQVCQNVLSDAEESANYLEASKASFLCCSRVNSRQGLVNLRLHMSFHLGFFMEGFVGSTNKLDFRVFSRDVDFVREMGDLSVQRGRHFLVSGTLLNLLDNEGFREDCHVVPGRVGRAPVFSYEPRSQDSLVEEEVSSNTEGDSPSQSADS